jgi:hypothetical protein
MFPFIASSFKDVSRQPYDSITHAAFLHSTAIRSSAPEDLMTLIVTLT